MGKWHGPEHAASGGMGTASAREGQATVGALRAQALDVDTGIVSREESGDATAPRSVPSTPKCLPVWLSVGLPVARSKSPVNWQTLFVEFDT